MREIIFTIIGFTLLYMGISTIFVDIFTVGKIGAMVGKLNRELFGVLGYIYPFAMLVPAYKIYKEEFEEIENIYVFVLSITLFLVAILTLQGMILDQNAGDVSRFLYDTFNSYIGSFGTFLFIVFFMLVSSYTLFDFSFSEVLDKAYDVKDSVKNINFLQIANKDADTNELFDLPLYEEPKTLNKPNQIKKDTELKIENNTKEDIIDVSIDDIEEELKKTIHTTDEEENIQEDHSHPNVKIVRELAENKKLLDQIETGKSQDKPKNFKLPKLDFLNSPPKKRRHINEAEIDKKIEDLLDKLRNFKIDGDVVATYSGPVVTTFEFKPAANIKVSKILTLQDDLAMALKAQTIRIQAPIPGKDVVGIEIPNNESETIYLREILETKLFKTASSPLTMVVGKDIVGNPFITDLKKLPHLLIAGTTGSGKSVGINAMLVSLLYRNSPDDLKFLMIDPKMLEFSIYNDIPHLLTPVITQAKQAIMALANMVVEMERRYKLMAKTKTKNIENYNEKAKKEKYEPFPYIVVIIDELADLMMTSGKDVEFYIARLAQMARASGIHLIVATQRPSVDVVTGLIKANLPSRMSFKVGQKIDSKVILDSTGADSLLGRGDMLFTPPGTSSLVRLHAPFVTEEEIEKIVDFLKMQREVEYDESYLSEPNPNGSSAVSAAPSGVNSGTDGDFDELYEDAKNIVLTDKKTSISYIQRKLQIGYNRSARIIEQLQMTGVLSAPNHKGQREILV